MTEQKTERWIGDLVGALCDPIIVMPGGWGDDLPEWLRTRVTMERLIENMQAMHEGREITATDAEAACYLFTASLTAPMDGDWSQIYLYVAGTEIETKANSKMPEDIKVDALTESQWRDLKRLKSWIYEQRVKHRKAKESQARRANRQAKQEVDKERLETRPAQPAFF